MTGSLPVAIYEIVAALPGDQHPWNRPPSWLIWLSVLIAAVTAQFLTWRDVRNERESLRKEKNQELEIVNAKVASLTTIDPILGFKVEILYERSCTLLISNEGGETEIGVRLVDSSDRDALYLPPGEKYLRFQDGSIRIKLGRGTPRRVQFATCAMDEEMHDFTWTISYLESATGLTREVPFESSVEPPAFVFNSCVVTLEILPHPTGTPLVKKLWIQGSSVELSESPTLPAQRKRPTPAARPSPKASE